MTMKKAAASRLLAAVLISTNAQQHTQIKGVVAFMKRCCIASGNEDCVSFFNQKLCSRFDKSGVFVFSTSNLISVAAAVATS